MAGYGKNPGWDPLEWLVTETRSRGMEFHAWLNPYRISVETYDKTSTATQTEINTYKREYSDRMQDTIRNNGGKIVDNPILQNNIASEFNNNIVLGNDGKILFNPASPRTIEHITNTITEIITKYDINGIHFDDYFYPSKGVEAAVEDKNYSDYTRAGGTLDIKDWRRSNVDKMVKSVSDAVNTHNNKTDRSTKVRFGISPAGVWAPSSSYEGQMCGTNGQEGGMNVPCGSYSSYTNLYADTKKWVEEEWLDYILPQNYFRLEDSHKAITEWWADVVSKTSKVKLYIGLATYRSSEWRDSTEIRNQMLHSYNTVGDKVSGFVFFSYRDFVSSDNITRMGILSATNLYKHEALSPVYDITTDIGTNGATAKMYHIEDNKYSIIVDQVEKANGYVIYKFKEGDTKEYTSENIQTVLRHKSDTDRRYYNFEAEDGYEYELKTANPNNEYYEDSVILRASEASENSKPTISNVTISNDGKDILYSQLLKIAFVVSDLENSNLNIKVQINENDGTYLYDTVLVDLGDGKYEATWTSYAFDMTNVKVEITANDGYLDSKYYSEAFNVVEKIEEPTKPSDPVEPSEPNKPEDPKDPEGSSCKSSSALYFTSIFTILATIALVLKKKN